MSKQQFTRGKGCRNRKLSDADRAEVVRLYTTQLPDGTWMGATTIGRRFGVRHPTIYRVLKLADVVTRDATKAHSGGKVCKPVTNVPVGDPPLCKCGCGTSTRWLLGKAQWAMYARGHYRQAAPYKDEAWLREQYEERRRTLAEIAAECRVSRSSVNKFAHKFNIVLRDRSESRIGRRRGAANHAWKGGVTERDYVIEWRTIARKIRDRDAWACQDCGEQRKRWGRALHVHHIDRDKLNNDPGNLISLCAACHRRRHRGEVI
jgi:hypothetical protein